MGQKTEVDLPGEVNGRVPDPAWRKDYFENPQEQEWHIGHTYNLSIGQGNLLATPIQMAVAFSAISNGGILYQPKIVHKIIDAEKKLVKEIPSEIKIENFVSGENLEIVRQGMRQAVTSPDGSAFSLNFLPVAVAAKTGTAQTSREDVYHNWVAVFAPYENPEIVLIIVVENVKGTRIAAQKAANEILKWYFNPDKSQD